jgi:hydrogenase nickel incorporation protein HypA/HybF
MVAEVHELSICSAIAKIVDEHAAGRPVERVRLAVGHLRQVVPDTLSYCWDIIVADTPLAGVPLDIDAIPASITCKVCASTTVIDTLIMRCRSCDSTDVSLTTGDELFVTSLDLAGV